MATADPIRTTLNLTAPVEGQHFKVWIRRILVATLILAAGASYQFGRIGLAIGAIPASIKWLTVFSFGILVAVFSAAFVVATYTGAFASTAGVIERLQRRAPRKKALNLTLFAALSVVLPYLVLGPYGRYLEGFLVRLVVLWGMALTGATLLHAGWQEKSWLYWLAVSLLLYAMVYRAALFIPAVSTYPFGLHYSESNTLYYASLMYGWRVYPGQDLGLPVDNPSRYLLMGLPFLIRQIPLWGHRLWQVLLWVGMTLGMAWALVGRLKIGQRSTAILWAAWGFLFIFQGPIYYHLLLAALIVLWGTDTKGFWKTMVIVILASAWAGASRINWIPVPGMLAATLYILEHPWREKQTWWNYLRTPLLWGVAGVAAALASLAVYAQVSGAGRRLFFSSVGSPLLWYRLLPSATYRTGVLTAIVAASVGLLGVILFRVVRRPFPLRPLRAILLGGILLVLFSGGLVVSVKIGGGNNIHNFDAFLVHLMVVGSYFIFDSHARDVGEARQAQVLPWAWLALVVGIPILFAIGQGEPIQARDHRTAESAVQRLQQIVDQTGGEDGEILFIDHRHLMAFGMLEGVSMVPEHDKVLLMEMAMSGNAAYLERFEEDLNTARYRLIITNLLNIVYKDREDAFAEEDNAWTREISTRLARYYRKVETVDIGSSRLTILAPRE